MVYKALGTSSAPWGVLTGTQGGYLTDNGFLGFSEGPSNAAPASLMHSGKSICIDSQGSPCKSGAGVSFYVVLGSLYHLPLYLISSFCFQGPRGRGEEEVSAHRAAEGGV